MNLFAFKDQIVNADKVLHIQKKKFKLSEDDIIKAEYQFLIRFEFDRDRFAEFIFGSEEQMDNYFESILKEWSL